ncbi:F-box only protein 16 [Chanos chanos]|uniref:F-box only protein 16 n=1 Tax=Chanos chanos TaxID=29144 RepID=A0A6J2V6H8_CHACN|nr:F-box only protein 16 [Chanos chanos]
MSVAARPTCNGTKMQTKMSTWTPLNHQLSNNNVFMERRNLLGKWFDKWTDNQRKLVFQDFLSRCTLSQLKYLRQTLCSQVPEEALDFITVLPRVISLYIFSFLDPRSLCRCAQVNWHWKTLAELDQLWMPKCLRLGWCIKFTPTPFEQGVWKRHYIETVLDLNISKPKTPAQEAFVIPEVKVIGCQAEDQITEADFGERRPGPVSQHGTGSTWCKSQRTVKGPPPWRDADRHPKDTIRFNYLENLDPIEQARQVWVNFSTRKQENNKNNVLSYKLQKAKSLMFLSLDLNTAAEQRQIRPKWATLNFEAYPNNEDAAKRLTQTSQWNAGIRPGPVRPPVPRLSVEGRRASQRSQRSTPTVPLFEEHPWKIPASSRGSNED